MANSSGGDNMPQFNGDLLGGDDFSAGGGTSSQDSSVSGEESNQRQQPQVLQLPRVGWGTDDGGGDDGDCNTNNNNMELPSINNNSQDDNSVSKRALSRNSDIDLAPIPEDMSMHGGAWPDYLYPDILDYDYDRRKYKYRRCGPNFKRRLCVVLVIVFAAIIGSRVKIGEKPTKQQQLVVPSDSDQQKQNNVGSSNNKDKQYEYPDMDNQPGVPEGVDVYQVIVDTLDPMVFDDSTTNVDDWDGSFFHAFECCGKNYNRIPCPYIAYCPLGPGKAPFGGTRIDSGESWAPIYKHQRNPPNDMIDWVALGSDNTCELYSKRHDGEQPSWANEAGADEAEGIKRHLMCCLETTVADVVENAQPEPQDDPNYIDRPPSLEEDEMMLPIPTENEGG